MGILALLLLAAGLAMDAFAVAISKGLALGERARLKHGVIVGLCFGVAQGVMPLIGFGLASLFARQIEAFDHWVAFGLLTLIGLNMLREAFFGDDEAHDDSLHARDLLMLSIATSIDALAVGVSFAAIKVNVWLAALIIFAVTAVLAATGVRIGKFVGERLQTWAMVAGGLILVGIGLKILLGHLGVIAL